MKPSITGLIMLLAVCLLTGCTAAAPATPTALPIPIATVTPTPAPVAIAPQDVQRKVKAGDMDRTYALHIPAGLNNQQLVPLVFVFHGYREHSDYVRTTSNFDPIANTNGFIVVYPDGSGADNALSWNAGTCCGEAVTNQVDETLFIRAMIEDVKTFARVDPKRIYSTGSSNGALLSYRLACEMSDTFAAIAPVSGVLVYSPCQPAEPVSVMHVHGMKDLFVPFDGNETFPPVRDRLTTWAKMDGCNGGEKEEQVNKILKRTSFSGCKPGIALELYTSDAMGHGWPSKYVAALLPISDIIWKFFAEHPKP